MSSGDSEDVWRIYLATLRRFYAGDFPAFRAYTILSGLAEVEKTTPRSHLEFLLQREVVGILELTRSRSLLPSQRFDLAIAAIRAGYIPEAQNELRKVRNELATDPDAKSTQAFVGGSEVAMAVLYLSRGDLDSALTTLDSARTHLAGIDDNVEQRAYAATRGQLELQLGHPETAEPMLRDAILEEEREARNAGPENILPAQQNRDLYAVLAGVWQAQNRPGIDILALWERYRLRILGNSVPVCPTRGLDCLKLRLQKTLDHASGAVGHSLLLGQIVLSDRVLVYRADGHGVVWNRVPLQQADLLAAANSLERVASSPMTSQTSVDQAARRIGDILISIPEPSADSRGLLLIEPDPLLGNLPWPAVETRHGPIGLQFALEEAPSILLDHSPGPAVAPHDEADRPLVIGASDGAGQSTLLPEVLEEARTVAALEPGSDMILSRQATEPQVAARLSSASLIHFAGHAIQHDGETRLLLAPSGSPSDRPYLDKGILLRNPPRHAELVVFSACSTGKRESGWNHDMGDIVDTLAWLGVPEVIATRWQIDSQSAVMMMDSFYRGLSDGRSAPEALAEARITLSRDARFRHPYYWAAYYASGVGNPDLHEVLHGNTK